MLTIYRITRVALLLSNKYNKSSEVLSELSKERHQALWPNGLLCTATGNALDSPIQTSFYPSETPTCCSSRCCLFLRLS